MLKFLVGSHNYNLNTEESDKDWKVFLYPSFDNLYNNTYNTRPTTITENEDVETKDIRQMMDLFEKCNPAYFELLYSKESDHSDNMSESKFLNYILKNRDAIIFHNLPKFFSACMGTYDQKRKSLLKGTSGTQHLMEKFGYDTKAGVHAYRNLDIIERLYVIIETIVNYRNISYLGNYSTKVSDKDKNMFLEEIISGYKSSIFYETTYVPIYKIALQYTKTFSNNFDSATIKDCLPEPYKFKYDNLREFMNHSFNEIWDIKDGKYSYNRLMELLRQKEFRVNELKNSEIFSKKYINFNVINQARDILKEEVKSKIIKETLRVDIKNKEDIKPEDKYVFKVDIPTIPFIDYSLTPPKVESREISILIKERKEIKNPILDSHLSLEGFNHIPLTEE